MEALRDIPEDTLPERPNQAGLGDTGPPKIEYGEVIPLFTGYLKLVRVCPFTCATRVEDDPIPIGHRNLVTYTFTD